MLLRISIPCLAGALALFAGVSAAGAQQVGPTIVVDAATGQVLQSDRGGAPWLPASLTKMMTTYVALRQVRAGRATMNTGLVVSQRAFRSAPSKMGFRPGTVVTLDNALKMIMVKSANDVSVTIAEGLGGSVENFAAMMNAEARRLGMSGTRFINPNGLPGAGQQTTARDMALLAYAMMREFPEHSLLWRMPAIRFGNRVMRNPNHLIGRYQGADGFKTGFTCASGFNVVATATRGGRKLIVVVLGATSARGRAETAAGLFERHFVSGGSGVGLDGIANDLSSAPPNIRDQACRRRGRGPVYIEAGEELDNEPVAAAPTDPGNLTYAQMMAASQQRQGRPGRPVGALAAMPGAVVSLLGPYRPTMDPVTVSIGGAGPMANPAPALASTGSQSVTLPASTQPGTVIVPAAPVAPAAAAAIAPTPGAIRRGTPAGEPSVRHGAIGAPMMLNGALPPERPAAAPPRAGNAPTSPAARPSARQGRAAAAAATRQPPRQQRPRERR
jgi:D-alanyl-D-alanine carboxypeptidase